MRKSLVLTFGTFLAAATAAGGIAAGPAAANDTVTLKAVAPINPDSYVSAPIFLLKDFVEKKTDGKVTINVLGADEVIPSANQFDAVKNGTVDVIVGMTSYYSGTVPEAMVLLYTNQNPDEQRTSGLFDEMKKAHSEKGGVVYYANVGGDAGQAFRYYLKEKIEKADFSGLKIRTSGSLRAFTEALGATPVSIPFSDLYLALERGMVDGFGTTYAGITDNALEEVTRYVLDHSMYSMNDVILFNTDKWNSLPEETRKILEEAAPEFENIVSEYNRKILADEDKLLVSKGMELFRLPDVEAKKFQEIAETAGWAQFMKDNPENGARIMELAK